MTVIGLAYWVYIASTRVLLDQRPRSLNRSPLVTAITIFFGILAVRVVQVHVYFVLTAVVQLTRTTYRKESWSTAYTSSRAISS